jgi:multidrug resistance protein, MATE family
MPSGLASLRLASECGATLRLALPLVLGQLAAVAMNVVDTVLAGRHGALTLAGVAVGSALWSLVILVLVGVLMAVPPSVSQLNGAERRGEIGPLFRQALWLGLALGLGLLLATRFSAPLLPLMGIAAEVQPGAMDFLRAIAWGAPALALVFVFRYTSEGLGLTRPTMVFGITTLLLLIPLGYWLMNGGLGLRGYGAAGLGAATAIVLWVQALGFGLWLHVGPRYRDLRLFAGFERPNPRLLGQLLRLGLPLGVSVLMEGTLFVASALIIGSMGAVAVAAHQIAINVASVLFMVPLGVAMATTVRVGFAAGGRDHEAVRRACAAGFAITVVTQLASAALLVLAPQPIARLYTDEAVVLAAVPPLLMLAALFQISDGLQVAAAGALRGLKDTRLPMLITAFAYWGVGMPLGALFAFRFDWAAPGMWVGLVLGLTVAAILLGWRLRQLLRARVFAAQ